MKLGRRGARQGGDGEEAVDGQGLGGEPQVQSRQQVSQLNSARAPELSAYSVRARLKLANVTLQG